MRSACFQIYGQPEPPAELLPLRAGPLTLHYDPTSGMVRRIKLGAREVLRGIYAAVRDRNWGTVPAVIHETRREIDAESFHIEFTATHHQVEIDFVWRGSILGTVAGEVRYEFDGEARSNFLRNRIGFCVLHPIAECAGARARQTRVDGRTLECRFPELIEPQIFGKSCFQQLRAVAHEVAPDLWAEVSFEGDTFEMEDQRNWTDASFKTYCTPLSLPFPVEVKAGTRVQQTVTLRLTGVPRATTAVTESVATTSGEVSIIIPNSPNMRLPRIGLGVASHGQPLSPSEIAALQKLQLAHLRVDLRLSDERTPAQFAQAVTEAAALKARLELALQLPKHSGIDREFQQLLAQHAPAVERILVLREGEPATTPETLAQARKQLGSLGIPIGAGSDCNFCELNREFNLGRLGLDAADFLFWSVNPQVHACDHLSIMETLEAQTVTCRTAQTIAGKRDLVVSPVTLKQRFNPVATGAEISNPNELPPPVDRRQLSDFAAAWTLGSFAALAECGVHSITYYETTGWRGVMECPSGSDLPNRFPSLPGERFRIHDVFAQLAGFTHCARIGLPGSSDIVALSLFNGAQLARTLIANLTTTLRIVKVRSRDGTQHTLKLSPYAFVSLEHRAELD